MSSPQSPPEPLPPQVALTQMITGYWVTQSLHVVAKMRIADLLVDGPKGCDELAASVGAQARALRRVLRALAGLGIFLENAAGEFALTPLSECLVSDRPGSLRGLAMVNGGDWYRAWSEFSHSVETGAPAWDKVYGKSFFQYLGENPEAGRIFDQAMSSFSLIWDQAVAVAYDFSTVGTLADIAGGRGSLLAAILRIHPGLRGILFDLPPVISGEDVSRLKADPELGPRLDLVPGDFFDGVPPGADTYLLKTVIHDWEDKPALRILGNCRDRIPEDGRLLVVEAVIETGNEPSFGKLLDLQMLVIGGCERTAEEYRQLLLQAGFSLERVYPTRSPLSVIEARPA